jgi:hypothetical protein
LALRLFPEPETIAGEASVKHAGNATTAESILIPPEVFFVTRSVKVVALAGTAFELPTNEVVYVLVTAPRTIAWVLGASSDAVAQLLPPLVLVELRAPIVS